MQNTAKYKGEAVDLTGQVFTDRQTNSGYTIYQVYLDPAKSDRAVIVDIPGSPKYQQGSYIEVNGVLQGSFSGTNTLGGSVTDPVVYAKSILTVIRDQAVAPTISTVTNVLASVQNNLSIQIDKVEFDANATCVFLTATK